MKAASDAPWIVHTKKDPSVVRRALSDGFVCIGWTDAGDLSALDGREKVRDALARACPHVPATTLRARVSPPYRFAHEMKTGDIVVAPIPTDVQDHPRRVAIGEITGGYRRSRERELHGRDCPDVREVSW